MKSSTKSSAGPFGVIEIAQKGSRFLVCSIAARDLSRLCGGLASSPARSTSPDSLGISNAKDIKALVTAVESPAFALEVSQLQADIYQAEDPYQRVLDRSRAKAISNYLKTEDALLPNGIILAANDGVDIQVRNHEVIFEWDAEELPQPFNIIDGQHRVEGLKLLAADNDDQYGGFQVPATILIDLPFYSQAELFATINGEQKKVSKSQIFDLLGYKPVEDVKLREQAYLSEMHIQRFCHHAIKVLNASQKSPWHLRIKMRGSGEGVVTQAAFVDHLSELCAPKKARQHARFIPVLYHFLKNDDLAGIARLLLIYFIGVRHAKPKFWETNESLQKCLFGKTNGVVVLLWVLHDMICLAGGVDKLSIENVSKYWRNVPDIQIETVPKGGSKGYQTEVFEAMAPHLFGKDHRVNLTKAMEPIKQDLIESAGLF